MKIMITVTIAIIAFIPWNVIAYGRLDSDGSPDVRGFCFDPSTTVELGNGKMIAMEDLHLGDEVVSCQSPDKGNCGNRFLDTVTGVTVIENGGPFSAHTFVFENTRQINVTSPHLMYTYQNENGKLVPVTTAAKDVRENDVMMLQDGSFSKVTTVVDFELPRKVSINTAGGSFFANGVLTTGMCDNYNSKDVFNVQAKNALESYASSHEDFNNCVLTAKKFPVSTEAMLDACLTRLS